MEELYQLLTILGLITGIIGAITGPIALYFHWQESRYKLKVELSSTIGKSPAILPYERKIFPAYGLTAKNISKYPITLHEVGIKLKKGDRYYIQTAGRENELPYELQPGKSYTITSEVSNLHQGLEKEQYNDEKIIAYFRDELGNYYYSKKYPKMTQKYIEWIEMNWCG